MQPGEPIPEHTHELRYVANGYVMVRWTIAPGEFVQVLEHRLVAGAKPGEHVHHKNKRRSDNRPDNLARISPEEHFAHHGKEHRTWNVEELRTLYEQGLSTIALAEHFGCDASNIYRALVRNGITPRKLGTVTEQTREALSASSKRRHADPAYKRKHSDGIKAAWAQRTPEERAAIGRRISEAKAAKHAKQP